MFSKSRWKEPKPDKPTQKKRGEESDPSLVRGAGEVTAGGGCARRSLSRERSRSAGGGSGAAGSGSSRFGTAGTSSSNRGHGSGSGVVGPPSRAGRRGPRRAPRPGRSGSSPSLHTSAPSEPPSIRSYRSLTRLDHTSARDVTASEHAMPSSHAKCGDPSLKTTATKPGPNVKNQRDDSDRMGTSNSTEAPSSSSAAASSSSSSPSSSSSSVVSSASSHHHCNPLKQQTKDEVYTLCGLPSGVRQNWGQGVLKNVRPALPPDVKSSLPSTVRQAPQSVEVAGNTPHPTGSAHDFRPEACRASCEPPQAMNQPALEQVPQESERVRRGSRDSFSEAPSSPGPSSSPVSSVSSSSSAPREGEELERGKALFHQRPLIIGTTHTEEKSDTSAKVVLSPSQSLGAEGDTSTLTTGPPNIEVHGERCISKSSTCQSMKGKEAPSSEKQTGQLLKELERTHKELSRLQQLNRNLQGQLEERELLSGEGVQNGPLSTSNTLSGQTTAMQRLQKINHDLRFELEAQRRSQEEVKEAELRRRVDLLAQQAQLLVTGDATALARTQLEQDRRRLHDQQAEWEGRVASLQTQLQHSEDTRREQDSCLLKMQQEAQDCHSIQKEADRLRESLQDATARLHANEEAQGKKEARLQKHLMLLQESQDRERRSLAACLAEAEQHAEDLQERLEKAEQEVHTLGQGQVWSREVEEAQEQLQEELASTVSAVQKLQEDREQLKSQCIELQNQLADADVETCRLQNRLKTEETGYYNLEHSYERACEELQLALGKVREREAEAQDMREGYERLLDRKEQELSEVLLKMEVLGNSLEETEVKLSEVSQVCTCCSSQQGHKPPASAQQGETLKAGPPLTVNDSITKVRSSSLPSGSQSGVDVLPLNGNLSHAEPTRTRSQSIDPSAHSIVVAGDDSDRFMSLIQVLETKLYATEEKLRDITQRLEEHQSHVGCQDPHLCSQLTQSRATSQHLSLLLHNQAKRSQRFAEDIENQSGLMADRFQATLKMVETSRQRLVALLQNHKESSTRKEAAVLAKQLATAAAYLHQGEKDAKKQQQESHYASKEESKMINENTLFGDEIKMSRGSTFPEVLPSEEVMESVGKTLMKEALLVEKMVSVVQSQHGIAQLHLQPGSHDKNVAQRLKRLTAQKLAFKMEKITWPCNTNSEPLEVTIGKVCAEAEVIYTALKLQWQYEHMTQGDPQVNGQAMVPFLQGPVNCDDATFSPRGDLADDWPPELATYEEQVETEERVGQDDRKPPNNDRSLTNKEEKERDWFERLASQLQRRAKTLRKLCQEICDSNQEDNTCVGQVNDSVLDCKWVQDQVMLIYILDRLYLDFNLEMQQCKEAHDRLHALCQDQDIALLDEQHAFSDTLSQLQDDNNDLRAQLESSEHSRIAAEAGNQRLLEDIRRIEDLHNEKMKKLEEEFQEKIGELQLIHEEEMKHLHSYYVKSALIPKGVRRKSCSEDPIPTSETDTFAALSPNSDLEWDGDEYPPKPSSTETTGGQIDELDGKSNASPVELGNQTLESNDAVAMRKAYQRDFEKLKASCDQGLTVMEEMHRNLVSDLKRQHQKEVAELLKEKDQLLREETAATMAAIVAMRKVHKEELERSRWSQHARESADFTQLHGQYEEDIRSLRNELEALSLQHTQKCLENCQMGHQLESERQALVLCQKEIQEVKHKQRVTEDMQHDAAFQSPDLYGMEQDIACAQNKLQTLTDSQENGRHIAAAKSSDDFGYATWSPSDHSRNGATGPGHDEIALTTHSDCSLRRKKSHSRQIRGVRSKSLKEGLSIQERMKLFESF